jgi:hypothetical protein
MQHVAANTQQKYYAEQPELKKHFYQKTQNLPKFQNKSEKLFTYSLLG